MVYLVERLQRRFPGMIKAPSTIEESFGSPLLLLDRFLTSSRRLATITGHGMYRMRRTMRDVYLGEIIVGCSHPGSAAEPPSMIDWKEVSCPLAHIYYLTYHLETPEWKMTWDFSSRKQKVLHFVVVHLKSSGTKPASVGLLRKNPLGWKGVMIWALNVNLGTHWLLGQKYSIQAICRGRSLFSLAAFHQKDPAVKLDLVSDIYLLDG